jgi:leucyl/phenylalanyl-tRNA---protein transferase
VELKSQNVKRGFCLKTEIFPNPESADENGIVCIGGKLSAPLLVEAYRVGIFPWPDEDFPEMLWFSPNPRGVLFLKDFHIPQSLKKWRKKTNFRVVLNQDFSAVVEACAKAKRPQQDGTWITQEIKQAYTDLFDLGLAYCVAVYDNGELVGGLYGVCIDRFLSAESMFFKKDNASKLGLSAWCEFLQRAKVDCLDIQMVTPVSEAFGGIYIERKTFLKQLSQTLNRIQSPIWWQASLELPVFK